MPPSPHPTSSSVGMYCRNQRCAHFINLLVFHPVTFLHFVSDQAGLKTLRDLKAVIPTAGAVCSQWFISEFLGFCVTRFIFGYCSFSICRPFIFLSTFPWLFYASQLLPHTYTNPPVSFSFVVSHLFISSLASFYT